MIAHNTYHFLLLNRHVITDETLLPAYKHVTEITLQYCTSKSWGRVGKVLACLPRLRILTLLHCSIGDELCEELRESKSLQRLRMGKQ